MTHSPAPFKVTPFLTPDEDEEYNMRLFHASPALLEACKNAAIDLEWRTKYKHNALPDKKQYENPAVKMLRELTAAILTAEPDWK